MANLGSGRGRCNFCDRECRDIRSHEYDYFPVMPVMMKASRSTGTVGSAQHCTIPPNNDRSVTGSPALEAQQSSGLEQDLTVDPVGPSQASGSVPAMHDYPQCHTKFLTLVVLEKHLMTYDHMQNADGPVVRLSKLPKLDIVQSMMQRPPQALPDPIKTFTYLLCQDQVGRKALAGHLRREYSVDKIIFFSFQPNRDMLDGRLACAHCLNNYTTEAALRLHYQRANCPILLIAWVKDQNFGPVLTTYATAPVSPSEFNEAPMTARRSHAFHLPTVGFLIPGERPTLDTRIDTGHDIISISAGSFTDPKISSLLA